MAQDKQKPDFKSDPLFVFPGSRFALPENLQSFTPDTVGLDSNALLKPRPFSLDREITFISPPSYQSRMPIYTLPDSDSRMPVKEFGDSINYTILKKEFYPSPSPNK
ncbi:hypothetical protein GCM10009119_24670 [Algoriphagus jejuensis]|uniref:Uncharacterized protein n=2 Tax=Algoriphagus jejuensis TaxID=419934 RepID=A0ABP3YDS6_9BACT